MQLDNVATNKVSQREMLKIVSLFRQNGFRGEYESFEFGEVQDEYMIVLKDEKSGVSGLFKADLNKSTIEFKQVIQ